MFKKLKLIRIVLLTLIAVVIGALFTTEYVETGTWYIHLLNRTIDVEGIKLLDESESFDALVEENFIDYTGAVHYISLDGTVKVTMSGYPDVLDGNTVTDISCSNNTGEILGIKNGMHIDEAMKELKRMDFYQIYCSDKFTNICVYKLGDVSITLESSQDLIIKWKVSLISTNKNDVVF